LIRFYFRSAVEAERDSRRNPRQIHVTILGLAVGDSMGVALEFTDPGTFEPVNDMIGRSLQSIPCMWTDDTSMALCLAESLIECRDFNPADQMKRYSSGTMMDTSQ
jgi:ADP-ribosylglycohydrolase